MPQRFADPGRDLARHPVPARPGPEEAGIIDAVGTGVAGWVPGQRVGVGWHGGHCWYCDSCRRGDFVTCQTAQQISGVTCDGGYAEYMIALTGVRAMTEVFPLDRAALAYERMTSGKARFRVVLTTGLE